MKSFKNRSFNFFKKISVYLAVFYLPFQTSKYFFIKQSYILGTRRDLLAPALYLKYFLFLTVFLFYKTWLIQALKKYINFLFPFLLFLFFNLFFSQNKPITLYKQTQVFIVLCFSFLLWRLKKENRLNPVALTLSLLSGSLIEVFLSLWQFIKGSSFQGPFYFLGERALNISSPAVAKTIFFGNLVLRAYGTFSHPNSLAGFYLFIYFLTYKSFFKKVSFWLLLLLRVTSAFLIFLSFSKPAIFAFLILNLAEILKKRVGVICKISHSLAILTSSLIFLSANLRKQSLLERLQQISQAYKIFLSNPIWGTGFGAYLTALSKNFPLIPAFSLKILHNVFFLLIVETGFSGIIFFIYLLKNLRFKDFFVKNKPLVFAVLITSLFDHYWWSLPQNLFLLSLIVV